MIRLILLFLSAHKTSVEGSSTRLQYCTGVLLKSILQLKSAKFCVPSPPFLLLFEELLMCDGSDDLNFYII